MPKREDEFWAAQKEEKGRGLCPKCGSPNVSYNPRFKSWRCNKCEHNFPIPSYGPGKDFGKEARWFGKSTRPRIEPKHITPSIGNEGEAPEDFIEPMSSLQ